MIAALITLVFAAGLGIGQLLANRNNYVDGLQKGYNEGYGAGVEDTKESLKHTKTN